MPTGDPPRACLCMNCRPGYGYYEFTSAPGPWTCPKCSSVYGPQQMECWRCNPPQDFKVTSSSGTTNARPE